MTKRERVLAAIAGQPTDRVPFSFWCHLPEGMKSGEAAVRVQADFCRRTDVDFVKMMIDHYRDISQGYSIQTHQDWAGLRLPAMDSVFIREQLEMIDRMADAVGDDVPVIYHMFSPFSVMRMIWGHDIIHAHLSDSTARPHILSALDRISDFQAEAALRYMSANGASGIMVTLSGAEQDGVGEKDFYVIVRPSDMKVLSAVKLSGKILMLHLCGWGKRPNHMTFWKDYPADVMDYDTVDDSSLPLKDARTFFTNAHSVMGGFGCRPDCVLRSGNRDALVRHVHKCVEEGGVSGYFVGAGSSFMPGTVDEEMFRLVGETLKGE